MGALTVSAIASAVASIVLAAVAFFALRASNQAVQEAREGIELTRQDLALTRDALRAAERQVDETRFTREADWQPLLVVKGDARASAPQESSVFVLNIGRGPALNVFAAISLDGAVLHLGSPTAAVAVGGEQTNLRVREHGSGQRLVEGVTDMQNQWAIFCEDQFGKRYRFVQGKAVHDEWPPSDPPRPPWTFLIDESRPI